jgi:hypothetical protein
MMAPPAVDPFGMTSPSSSGASAALGVPQLAPPPMTSSPSLTSAVPHPMVPPQKKGMPIFAIAGIAFAGCFGIAVAILAFMPKPQAAPPTQVVIVPTPNAPTTATAAPPSVADSASPAASDAPAGSNSPKIASNHGASPPSATHKPAAGGGGGADLHDLIGTGGGSGPVAGPAGGGGGTAPAGLDASAVQTVVRNRAPGVKRKCWDSGTNDQKTSANVQVAVTVAPNGSVQDANATGDDPQISNCIAREVKTWSFPPPGSTTTVNIPFHFVRQ